ncbi:MAG: DUF58 domain-containing protein [Clostridiales bacterium]|nr:DUF58 domain-containing protein [Clostridiales bacterium]
MTARGFYTLLFGAVMMLTALSVGSQGAFLLGACALIACALALASVLFARFTCRLSQRLESCETERGGSCAYTLSVALFAPLPVAPLSLRLSLPSGKEREFILPARLFGRTDSDNLFPCPHVGVFPVGVLSVAIGDVFGLFRLSHPVKTPLVPVTVLPIPREAEPLPTSPGEGESSRAQRAQADRTTPSDTRAWQEGDELKRVHWKLSMRRQELMVHTYETPQRPDALVLLDLAPLPYEGALRAAMIDALTETCAGVLKSLLDSHRIARMPLSGDHPRELSGQEPQALAPMLHALAQESFSRPCDFSRVLLLASRRMRRTGSTAVITAALTPTVADAIIALSRMGPRMRVCLVAPGDLSQEQSQLLYLLETCGVNTQHVSV